jgi:hypothetical protein
VAPAFHDSGALSIYNGIRPMRSLADVKVLAAQRAAVRRATDRTHSQGGVS